MIAVCIILLVPLLFILFSYLKEKDKEIIRNKPDPKRRRHTKSNYTYTGLPWMGRKKIRKK